MPVQRMVVRIPDARQYTTAKLAGYCLRFHKVSTVDGSGKCDIVRSNLPDAIVYGVLYEIQPAELATLDRVEGSGYERISVEVSAENVGSVTAVTYIARNIDARLRPYAWYKEHVLRGVRANGFPAAYIKMLESVACDEDPDCARHARELAIYDC